MHYVPDIRWMKNAIIDITIANLSALLISRGPISRPARNIKKNTSGSESTWRSVLGNTNPKIDGLMTRPARSSPTGVVAQCSERPRPGSWRRQELRLCWRIVARSPVRYNRRMFYKTIHDSCISLQHCSVMSKCWCKKLSKCSLTSHLCSCSSGKETRHLAMDLSAVIQG